MTKVIGAWLTRANLFLFLGAITIAVVIGNVSVARGDSVEDNPFSYISPLPGSSFLPPGTTIAVRHKELAGADLLDSIDFTVTGSMSGGHNGEIILARDGRTVLFSPNKEFLPGEIVNVTINGAKLGNLSSATQPFNFAFGVSEPLVQASDQHYVSEEDPSPKREAAPIPPHNYLTAPGDMPTYAVERWPGNLGEGYIFLSIFEQFSGQTTGYVQILDNNGEPIYYDSPFSLPVTLDFKKQPNGTLTFFAPGPGLNRFFALDSNYKIVDDFQAGNGYPTDLHDLQVLENGNALLLVHDRQIVDMSLLDPNASKEATVIGCIIQEVDRDNNVVFQWRSWDHIDITDTNRPLDSNPLRYIHCNSIGQDHDGNLLLSSRNLDEVTKIDGQAGSIIWRLGGRRNQFSFVNDPGFSVQHDARRIANGNITLYDNGTLDPKTASRGVEFHVDNVYKIASKVSEFYNTPDVFGYFTGNMQRLPNGNSLVGWGASSTPLLTEFAPNGDMLLTLSANNPYNTYRAFRFPWQGFPTWPPVLVATLENTTAHLYFSWNGSTETVAYRVYGGRGDQQNLLATVPRDGFEATYSYDMPESGLWYFSVVPLDKFNQEGPRSNSAPVQLGGHQAYAAVVAVKK